VHHVLVLVEHHARVEQIELPLEGEQVVVEGEGLHLAPGRP